MKRNPFHIPWKEYPRAPDFEMNLRIWLDRGIFNRKAFEKHPQCEA